MRPPGFRLPLRLALAGLIVPLLLPAVAVTSDAANSDVSLTVHAGYQDVVKLGEWTPVTVDARSNGPAVDGTLEIQESLNAQSGVSGLTVYQQPISLASGAAKRLRVYVEVDTTGATVTARIVQGGHVTASQSSILNTTTQYLIGVLSDQPTTLDDFAAIHPASIAARVVHLQPAEVAENAVALRAFDILAIDDFATDGLTDGQRSALADFVYAGGDLLIGTGAAWHKTLAGLPAAILPMQVGGAEVVDATTAGTASVEIATGSLTNGQPWLTGYSRPLLVERAVGAGTVTLATFDWNQLPVAVAGSSRDVLRQVLSRAVFGSGGAGQNFTYGFGGGGGPAFGPFGGGTQPSVASKSGALIPVLGNLPGLDLPSLELTGVLVLLYVVIVGPLNYIVLGAMHRRALAWVTVPLIAMVATAAAYGAGVLTKGRSVQLNQVAMLHLQSGWDRAYQETYTGVIPPSRGDYQALVTSPSVLISPVSNNMGPWYITPGSLRVDVSKNLVTLTGMVAFSLGGFATEEITAAPRLSAELRLINGTLVGTVENHSNLTFTDAVIIAGDSYQTIPTLKPGATASVNLVPKMPNPYGQPLFTRVYSTDLGNGASTTLGREANAKSQMLSILPTGGSFKGIASFANPMLVAFTHQSFQQVTVNGGQPRSTTESAIAVSLPVDQIGTGPLPAGIVNSRIVDVVGDSQGNGPAGVLALQNGSVTYEFDPVLAPGHRLTRVSVTSQNPYMSAKVGPPGVAVPATAGVQGQVWDWSTSTWSDVTYQDNGTTALPESAVNPSNGMVRVRLTTNGTGGGFLTGTLSLSGTVQ